MKLLVFILHIHTSFGIRCMVPILTGRHEKSNGGFTSEAAKAAAPPNYQKKFPKQLLHFLYKCVILSARKYCLQVRKRLHKKLKALPEKSMQVCLFLIEKFAHSLSAFFTTAFLPSYPKSFLGLGNKRRNATYEKGTICGFGTDAGAGHNLVRHGGRRYCEHVPAQG
ncbi:MAG: hypothetical protein RR975_02645 [Clostridia bacterium]